MTESDNKFEIVTYDKLATAWISAGFFDLTLSGTHRRRSSGLSAVFRRAKIAVGRKTGVEARAVANLIGLALSEAVALTGFVLHATTGWPYARTLFLIGGAAMLLHFPRSA